MLYYPIPQSLGCAFYVAGITLARKFINDRTFLVGRHAILLNGWKISYLFFLIDDNKDNKNYDH